jgi:Phosphotransferase enzyme family
VLIAGTVHGDASVGNVIRDRDGHPLLADLDGFAIGPREWDLVLTALYYENFGWHTAEEYRTFADTYGYDVMAWPGHPVLRDVREFLMVAWEAVLSRRDPERMFGAVLGQLLDDWGPCDGHWPATFDDKGWRPYLLDRSGGSGRLETALAGEPIDFRLLFG